MPFQTPLLPKSQCSAGGAVHQCWHSPLSHLSSAQLLPVGSWPAPHTELPTLIPIPLPKHTGDISRAAEGGQAHLSDRECSLENSFQYYFIYFETYYFNIFQNFTVKNGKLPGDLPILVTTTFKYQLVAVVKIFFSTSTKVTLVMGEL